MTLAEQTAPRPAPNLTPGLTRIMALAAGLAVAAIYTNQPLLGLMADQFQAGAHISLIAMTTQLGYALGILLLVPLGDRADRRRLILLQCVLLVAALAAAALAPGLGTLAIASLLIGVFATIAQQIVPFAAELAAPETRGRVVGVVMSGLLAGILLARTVSGLIGQWAGWRAAFALDAVAIAALGLLLARVLPRSQPGSQERYTTLLRSLWTLVRTEPALRRASLTQGCLFAAFSAFWTILALLLQTPRFNLGSGAAGLFGVLALGGVAIAPMAGKLADTRGPHGAVRAGAALVLAACLIMAVWISLPALVIGVVVLDAGLQLAMISNQSIIFALRGEIRSRVNTIYMTTLFLGGAAGSEAASLAWHTAGWPAVMALGAALSALALLIQLAPKDRPCGALPRSPPGGAAS